MTQIDVSKLEVGQVYSYKQLCELTGAEYKKGKNQALHIQSLKEDGFARFIKVEKIGYGKYLLQEIYDKPLEIQNRRQAGNASVYFKFIELIILKYLSKKYGIKEVVFSRRKLWLLLGMINENYRKLDKDKLMRLTNNIVTEEDIDDFYLRSNSKLNRILKTALDNLAKRKLIDYEERTIICKDDGRRYHHVIADNNEREQILAVEFETLQEFNCNNINEIVYKKLSQQYYCRIKEIINDEWDWKYYYKAYSIIFNHENIEKSIPRIEKTLDEAINELNHNIVMALNKEAETTYKRKVEKYYNLIEESEFNSMLLFKLEYIKKPHDNYVIAQQMLANELINISKEDPIDNMFDITLIQADIDDDIELDELFNENNDFLEDF